MSDRWNQMPSPLMLLVIKIFQVFQVAKDFASCYEIDKHINIIKLDHCIYEIFFHVNDCLWPVEVWGDLHLNKVILIGYSIRLNQVWSFINSSFKEWLSGNCCCFWLLMILLNSHHLARSAYAVTAQTWVLANENSGECLLQGMQFSLSISEPQKCLDIILWKGMKV